MIVISEAGTTILHDDGDFMYWNVYYLMVESLLWGIHLVVFAYAVSCLIARRRKSRAWYIIVISVVLLFTMSTILYMIQILYAAIQLQRIMLSPATWTATIDDREDSSSVVDRWMNAYNPLFQAEFLIGDGVVIWRTWVLFQGSPAIYIPIITWMASLAGTAIAEHIIENLPIESLLGISEHNIGSVLDALNLANYALSVATNGTSTAMIGYKAWQHRAFLKSAASSSRSGAAERILSLLVESGLIYLCFWAINTVSAVNTDNINNDKFLMFTNVSTAISDQGLYPAIIIVLVEHQRSIHAAIRNCYPSHMPISIKPLSTRGG